ncbi:MAG TPA: efflux RND transporter periplasmic adaptor subunit [Blastocatellia bacterium]
MAHIHQEPSGEIQKPRIELSKLRIERGDHDDEEQSAGRRLFFSVAVPAIVLVALAAGGYRYWSTSVGIPEVEIGRALVESGDAPSEILSATGYVVAHRKAAVSPKVSGKLDREFVDIGSVVKINQPLATLEHNDVDAQLDDAHAALATTEAQKAQAEASKNQAEANLNQARATEHQTNLDYGRQTKLLKDGVAAQSDFDNAEAKEKVADAQVQQAIAQINSADAVLKSMDAQVESYKAKIRLLEAQLEYTTIRSPFDGLVISKDAEVGEVVAPAVFGVGTTKASVFTIIDPKTLEVEADVNESNITLIQQDGPAEIVLDAMPDRKFKAQAYQVVPTADRQKATVKVKVRFLELDPKVLPDMNAKVTFLQRASKKTSSTRVTAPKSAIVQRSGSTAVLLLNGDRVHAQPVVTGADYRDRVEIKQGLIGGETVVTRGGDTLADGSRVKLKSTG